MIGEYKMNARDKGKIKVLFSEAKVWVDSNTDYLTGLDNDCEEISVACLTVEEVKRLLDNLKAKLLKDYDQNEDPNKPKVCPVCGSSKVKPVVKPGSWGYYPASAWIECKECGTRSREFDGKDDCDQEGAIKKATIAWNRRNQPLVENTCKDITY